MKLLVILSFACNLQSILAQGSVLGSLSVPSHGDILTNPGPASGFVHGTPVGSFHIDQPGEHGNPIDGQPFVHQNDVPLANDIDNNNNNNNKNNMESPVGSVPVNMPREHGKPINGFPIIHREFPNNIASSIENTEIGSGVVEHLHNGQVASPGTGEGLGDFLGIPSLDFSEASSTIDPLSGFDQGLLPTNTGDVGGGTVQLTRAGRRRNRRPKSGRNKKRKKARRKKTTSTKI